jgi:hypothetical protein
MSTTVEGRARIPLPIETCWEYMRDLTRSMDYVPGLTNTVITTDRTEGVGASRIVTHRQFGDMNETVTEWDEGKGMTLRLHKGEKGPSPMSEAVFRYELEPAEGGCEIHTQLTYSMGLGPIGRLLDAIVMRRIFQRNVRDVAVSIAENYVTGQKVPESELPRLREKAL